MASLDAARYNLIFNGYEKLDEIINLTTKAREKINKINGLKVVESIRYQEDNYDITKLGIDVSKVGLSGFEVYEIMHGKYNVQLEMADFNHVLAIVSLGDDEDTLNKLVEAFKDLSECYYKENTLKESINFDNINPQVKLSPRDAFYSDKEKVSLEKSSGRLCGESILAYPPGIPIVAPGEVITENIINVIKKLMSYGAFMVDSSDTTLETILVIENK